MHEIRICQTYSISCVGNRNHEYIHGEIIQGSIQHLYASAMLHWSLSPISPISSIPPLSESSLYVAHFEHNRAWKRTLYVIREDGKRAPVLVQEACEVEVRHILHVNEGRAAETLPDCVQ